MEDVRLKDFLPQNITVLLTVRMVDALYSKDSLSLHAIDERRISHQTCVRRSIFLRMGTMTRFSGIFYYHRAVISKIKICGRYPFILESLSHLLKNDVLIDKMVGGGD